jgi:hypothetical protein
LTLISGRPMKQTTLKVTALSLLIIVSLMILVYRGVARGSRNENRSAPTTQVPAQEKTVEKVHENIKVLTGMPQSQFYPSMAFMSSSLGVRCDFCHVNTNGQLDFAADDKEEKQTARAMIKMVVDLNKNTFFGNPQVSCYTCHAGRTSPQGFPTLPMPLQSMPPITAGGTGSPLGPDAAAQASPRVAPPTPSVDDILNKYVMAIGGKTAIERIKSCVIKGTRATSSGPPTAYETYQTLPDKGYESIASQGGTIERAVSGARGWERSGEGVQELAGQQVADLKLSFQLFLNVRLKDQYSSMRITGKDKIGDRDVYVVSATRADSKGERLYFDAENGMLLRRITYARTMIGLIPQQTDFEDYREVEGVKFPFKVRVSSIDAGNPVITRTLEEIKINAPVDNSKFDKPRRPGSPTP